MNIKFTTKAFGAVAAAMLLSTSANAAMWKNDNCRHELGFSIFDGSR